MTPRRTSSRSSARKRRWLQAERLEARRLMAAELSLHNAAFPADVNVDGRVSSSDALAVINYLGRLRDVEGESVLASNAPPGPVTNSVLATDQAMAEMEQHYQATAASLVTTDKMVDVDNNGIVSAGDALLVINQLLGEGESPMEMPRPEPLDFSLFPKAGDVDAAGGDSLAVDVLKNFKTLDPGNPDFKYTSVFNHAFRVGGQANELTTEEVNTLLERASAATRSEDAIIAVVDRSGRILGVRVEAEVDADLVADEKALAFAIDGAVAKARTAAFFSNNAAPITSRTIRSLSQSTMVQRVVESSPVATEATERGPGFVAPIGVGGKFPPEIDFTPQVDLFAIEHQSRDSQRHPGADGIKGNLDDFYLRTRFNANPDHIPANSETFFQTWPESYGVQTDRFYDSQARGIATLPGGVPLYKAVTADGKPVTSPLSKSFNLVGGIGVFFPGEKGYASYEQGFKHQSQTPTGLPQSEVARTNASRVLEAEFAAFIAAAGKGLVNPFQPAFVRDLSGFNKHLPKLDNFFLPTGRIDLVGITLEIYGPNPTREFRQPGVDRLIAVGQQLFGGVGHISGSLRPINHAGELLQPGQPVPEGWLVAPHSSATDPGLTAEVVDQIIAQGVQEALRTRAAIRLDIDGGFRPGARTSMVLSVADTNGELLGAFRMPDATVFSIDVSIAKARNTAYYADADALRPEDRIDFNNDGQFGPVSQSLNTRIGDTLPLGTALTNRTFRFVVEPRFPTGVELDPSASRNLVSDPNLNLCDQKPGQCLLVGPQSILRLPGIDPRTGENIANIPLDASVYGSAANSFSVLAFDAFNASRNFRDPGDAGVIIHGDNTVQPLANQNGIVFFPGSTPLYLENDPELLIGGFGVSGDGVDQDDVVTSAGQRGYAAPASIRADQYTVAGVRLPFQKFNRNPLGP